MGKDVTKLGWSQCLKLKWCGLDKATKTLVREKEGMTDEVVANLQAIIASPVDQVDKKLSTDLKKRKMLSLKQFKTYAVTQGPNFSIERKKVTYCLVCGLLSAVCFRLHAVCCHAVLEFLHRAQECTLQFYFANLLVRPMNSHLILL